MSSMHQLGGPVYRKPASIIPANDVERLASLRSYDILDTPPEETFDKVARLAAQIFGTSSAFINFVDEDRVFFKSNLSSLRVNEVPREHSLCSLTILAEHRTSFSDTHDHPDLLSSPYVSAPGGIRFYAGAPLRTPNGLHLGAVCVVDEQPRQASEQQLAMLESLAGIVMEELEHRKQARLQLIRHQDLMKYMVHELKNPAQTALLAAEVLSDRPSRLPDEVAMDKLLIRSLHSIRDRLDNILTAAGLSSPNFELRREALELDTELAQMCHDHNASANSKDITIHHRPCAGLKLHADRERLRDVLHNLIGNAIKFSPEHSTVHVSADQQQEKVVISVRDEGPGLVPSDMEKLFTEFGRLKATPTGGEKSSGLGLFIAYKRVAMHGGTLSATSPGKGKGATFQISLPSKEAEQP